MKRLTEDKVIIVVPVPHIKKKTQLLNYTFRQQLKVHKYRSLMQDLPRVHWGFTHQTEDMHGPHAQTNTFTHTVTADTHIHTQTQSTEGQSLLFIVVEKKRSFVLQLWDGGVCCFTVSVRNRQDKWATTSQCSSSKPSIYAPSPPHSQSEPGMKVISLTLMET